MSSFKEPRWAWQSAGVSDRVAYMAMDGRISIAELIEKMKEIAPGVPLDQIEVNWATVRWSRPPNAEEIAERVAAGEANRVRQDEWERKTLARLLEKYGIPQ